MIVTILYELGVFNCILLYQDLLLMIIVLKKMMVQIRVKIVFALHPYYPISFPTSSQNRWAVIVL